MSSRGAAGDAAISLLIHGELNFGDGPIGLDKLEELDRLGIQKLLRLQLLENLEEEVLILDIRGKVILKEEYQLMDVEQA